MAELGLFGIVFPEEWGGSDGDFTSLCIAIEEIGQVSQSLGITLSAGGRAGRQPDPLVRHRRAAGASGCPSWSPARARRLRPHRARCRQRRRRHPHHGRVRRGHRRVGDQRQQGVHHQLGHADHVDRHRHRAHRRTGRDHLVHRARGHARPDHRARLSQARLARQRHPRHHPHRLPRARGQHARRAGQRAAQLPRDPRRRAHRHQRARRRLRAGVPRPGGRLRQGAPGVRRPDRPLPGARVPARRPRRGGGEQPQPHLRGGAR